MRKNNKRILRVAILSVVLIIAGIATAAFVFSNSPGDFTNMKADKISITPVDQLQNSFRLTMDVSRFPDGKYLSIWSRAEDSGSTAILLGDIKETRTSNSNTGGLHLISENKGNVLANTFAVYSQGDEIAFQIPDIFGDDIYGFNLADINEEEKEEFWYTSLGIDFAEIISEKSYSITIEDNFIGTILSDGKTSVNEYLVDISGADTHAIVVEVLLDHDQIKEIYQYINTLSEAYVEKGIRIVNWLADTYNISAISSIESILNELADIADQQNVSCQVKAMIDPASGILMKIETRMSGPAVRTVQMDFTFGKNPAADPYLFQYSSTGVSNDDIRKVSAELTYALDEASQTEKYGLNMKLGGTYTIHNNTVFVTKKMEDGSFSAVFYDGAREVKEAGYIHCSDDVWEISLGDLSVSAKNQEEPELPDFPEYQSIIDLTAFDMVRILTGHQEITSFEDFLDLEDMK